MYTTAYLCSPFIGATFKLQTVFQVYRIESKLAGCLPSVRLS